MALNQRLLAPAGLTLTCRVEQPVEPGQPRQFWDGAKARWSTDPAARVAVTPDPGLAGCYLVAIPTAQTRAWPDKTYHLAVLDGAGSVVGGGPVDMAGGDDGALARPSVDLPWPDGRTIHLRNAYAK